ncbi:zinc finger protein 761-like [Mercenaria mercenaria]|uniref:zinc finger protein 761-like n=1 Tax=Mercenaria mercenaria TaxID=6596 RepID=UPI00234F5EBA|nr:zinc finger protein 761-like [Mercenaria mercenaria]XP_053380549.1 zinc finger protein 761-like [Mercenaria mercenaria]
MDGGFIMEPDLTQAVRIVLKYEIQSLLSRLSETGEEYIVLTASTGEGTCGHIGSVKGEGFAKSSGLHTVKQEFLSFCTGKEKSPPPPPPVLNANSTPKPNRRKSTPRCKFQKSVVVMPVDDPPAPEISKSVKETDLSSSSLVDSACALDLSEKSGGYSYTLESKDNVMKYNGNASQSTFPGFQYEELDNNNESYNIKLPRFTWQDEKLKCVSEEVPESSVQSFPVKFEKDLPDQNTNAVLDHMPFVDVKAYGELSIFERGRQQLSLQKRRKNRKAPAKTQKKDVNLESNLDPASSSVVKMENENAVGFDNQMSSLLNVTKMSEEENPETVNNHSDLKSGANVNIRKTSKKHSINDIADMKSAFEEIGNMAKCLICNKILANKNNRTFHWRSHVGDKRYTCDICNKAFTHPSNMRSHRKIHTDEKPFPCDLCERRFRRRDYLLQHLERFHYNPKQSAEKSLVEGESNSS